MRRPQRLIAAAVLIALSSALAGCGSTGNFDPTDLLDFLDTKKKLPGERKPVFPEGVPGVEQGVPKDLYKGAQEQQLQQQTPPVAEAPPEPKPQHSRKTRHASPKHAAPAEPAADTDEGAAVATKPTPAPKRKRARVTAPEQEQPAPQQTQQEPQQPSAPPQQQPDLKPFPAPLPSGSFQR
jgi:outer membrane biosynthesis protein TonB